MSDGTEVHLCPFCSWSIQVPEGWDRPEVEEIVQGHVVDCLALFGLAPWNSEVTVTHGDSAP